MHSCTTAQRDTANNWALRGHAYMIWLHPANAIVSQYIQFSAHLNSIKSQAEDQINGLFYQQIFDN